MLRPRRDGTRGRDGRRGQALTEFALVAPIFFLLLFGIIQLGLLFGAQNGLVNGVRDTTRRAATYRVNELSLQSFSLQAICDILVDELEVRLSKQIPGFVVANLQPDPIIAYEWKSNNDNPPTYFLVAHLTVDYKHPLYVPLVSIFLDGVDGQSDGALRLEATEQMRVENPDLSTLGTDQTCP